MSKEKGSKLDKKISLADVTEHFKNMSSRPTNQEEFSETLINEDVNNPLNKDFDIDEVKKVISQTNNNKANGCDYPQ